MRVWGWKRISRNRWRFGDAIQIDIVPVSRENYIVRITDEGFRGRYDYVSGHHAKWVDAYSDVTRKMKRISAEVRRMLGKED